MRINNCQMANVKPSFGITSVAVDKAGMTKIEVDAVKLALPQIIAIPGEFKLNVSKICPETGTSIGNEAPIYSPKFLLEAFLQPSCILHRLTNPPISVATYKSSAHNEQNSAQKLASNLLEAAKRVTENFYASPIVKQMQAQVAAKIAESLK